MSDGGSAVRVRLEAVSKKFARNIPAAMRHGLSDMTRNLTGRRVESDSLRDDEFWALHDVDFQVEAGRCLGVVGVNGAGKTTLLQLLHGIYPPDRGRITLRGRVGALIHLGAGFHPQLTGRENIAVHGAVLGMSPVEIRAREDEIIAFADLGEFIDSPVKIYSSGMYVRLGFAIATQIRPDVLLVDEVLSVGDNHFRYKCFRHIRELLDGGTAIVLVSHRMNDLLTLCDSAIRLDHGRIAESGDPRSVVEGHLGSRASVARDTGRVGGTASLSGVQVVDAVGRSVETLVGLEPFEIRFAYHCETPVAEPVFGIRILDESGREVFASSTHRRRHADSDPATEGRVAVSLDRCALGPGHYSLTVTLSDDLGERRDLVWWERAAEFDVMAPHENAGSVQIAHRWQRDETGTR